MKKVRRAMEKCRKKLLDDAKEELEK